jgi:hypothetical protein
MEQPFDILMEHIRSVGLEIARNRNEFRDHGKSYNAYLAAQDEGRSMQTHLDSLVQLIEPEADQSAEIQRHLKAIRDGLSTQQSHLDQLVESVPPMARKPPTTDELAEKVFNIPELLEKILLYLSPADLLRVQRVSHLFFNATEGSPKIQFKMGLRPQENCHITFPPALLEFHMFSFSLEPYTCFGNSRQTLQENEVNIRAGFYGGEKNNKMLKLGKRCRDMLICQPPIKTLNAYTRCCHPTWSWRGATDPVETITVEGGFRMGDLIDVHERITAAHRLCPDADPPEHDDEGFVRPRVSFETRVVTLDDDPALLDRKQHDKRTRDEDNHYTSHAARMRPYIAAKQSGELFSRLCLKDESC